MKTLTLIRHAKSSWTDPSLSDFDRPLNPRGQRDAPVMGERLARRHLVPDLMLSSPARRALTTARLIAPYVDYKVDAIHTDRQIYGAPAAGLLDIIRSLDSSRSAVFLVGHNPGFTELANLLGRKTDIDNVPTCGVVHLALDVCGWSHVGAGNGRIVFFDYPKRVAD